jgi:hypothetical protein
MAELRTLADNCPACILAAIRQRKLQSPDDFADNGPLDFKFDFKAEMEVFWSNQNEYAAV